MSKTKEPVILAPYDKYAGGYDEEGNYYQYDDMEAL